MLTLKQVRRVIIAVIGGTVLLIGFALVVLPGPAFVVVPAGLAILATEFEWARRWLQKSRQMARNVWNSQSRGPSNGAPSKPAQNPGNHEVQTRPKDDTGKEVKCCPRR
jgi:hypothetical protein